jgi:hypothetical protein
VTENPKFYFFQGAWTPFARDPAANGIVFFPDNSGEFFSCPRLASTARPDSVGQVFIKHVGKPGQLKRLLAFVSLGRSRHLP